MKTGIPREIKVEQSRVACTPGGARMLVQAGHAVLVEKNAGKGSGFHDDQYSEAGARIVRTADDAWAADMVIKVKEQIEPECKDPGPEDPALVNPRGDLLCWKSIELSKLQISNYKYQTVLVIDYWNLRFV